MNKVVAKKTLLIVSVFFVLLFVGCYYTPVENIPEDIPQSNLNPAPTGNQVVTNTTPPPSNRTWISPGKVNISNYYLGARADYNITIHNGKPENIQFDVKFRTPDYVDAGYGIAPSIYKDWIIIADMTPVLASQETKDILVSVQMPVDADEDVVRIWQVASAGTEYLKSERNRIHGELLNVYREKYKGQEDCEGMAVAEANRETDIRLQSMPETSLLQYIEDIRVVTYSQFQWERPNDSSLVNTLKQKNYVETYDLSKDKWEFWISVFDTQQPGQLTTELASRWIITMR
jgi:hypothetical protein